MQVKHILNEGYGIQEECILDNHMCKFNLNVKPISALSTIGGRDHTVILSCLDLEICEELEKNIESYNRNIRVIHLPTVRAKRKMKSIQETEQAKQEEGRQVYVPKIGKYSSGPLCSSNLVESIGAFCSFAIGTAVVMNHPMEFITTHNLLFGTGKRALFGDTEIDKNARYYFEGVEPRAKLPKTKRITIGNDVWLGQNVLITNGANIGNGVIAGAGAVITKDVPDFAIVVGVPAKIIRYRYTPEQIEKLNKIAWWDWQDEVIRDRYDDFYLPIDAFLKKYYKENVLDSE